MKSTLSATLQGFEAHTVSVEATMTRGLPAFSIVGLASSAIQESKERVKSALLSMDFQFPPLRITLNLSPSDLNKDGSHFDLSIALLIALQKSSIDLSSWAIFGELGLDGSVKETQNLFALLLSFAQNGHKKVIVPQCALPKLTHIQNLELYGVQTLKEAIEFFEGKKSLQKAATQSLHYQKINIDTTPYYYESSFELDFKEVKGQELAKRAALIAAAGGHNLVMEGNPGSGKSMIAKRLGAILPPVSQEEILHIAKLDALEGNTPHFKPKRPVRAPHHSATLASIFGGGSFKAKIGEAGLAHLGLLFFDELPHFSKQVLEALREPLEDRKIHISRVNTKIEYPTEFLFVAALNPCPCGNMLSKSHECRCTDAEIKRYKNRLSDPFLDRMDLYVLMQESSIEDKSSIDSKSMQNKVIQAFIAQKRRKQRVLNGRLDDKETEAVCHLNHEVEALLYQAQERFKLSARSLVKVKKVARTIADLEGHNEIVRSDLLEALSYRRRPI